MGSSPVFSRFVILRQTRSWKQQKLPEASSSQANRMPVCWLFQRQNLLSPNEILFATH
jgi:hypothetical protein